MTQTLIKENVEDVKFRKQLKMVKSDALIQCAVALVNNQKRKEEILADVF